MAAAEALRDRPQQAQQARAAGIVAIAEGLQRERGRMAHFAREGGVIAAAAHRRRLRFQQLARGIVAAGADEGHHRVHVVEGVVAGAGERSPAVGERRPAPAERHAAQVQAPEHRRGVDHLEHDARAAPVDRAIEQREHLAGLAEVEVEHRQVPPVVHGEEAVARPGVGVGAHPGDAVRMAALHFHDVHHGVLRPAVAPLEFERAAALRLGLRVGAGFLQPEGVHAEQRVVTGHGALPGRQRARDPVAQHARVAGEEIERVSGLQRQRVARVVDAQVLQRARRVVPAALQQQADRLQVACFAPVGRQAQSGLPGGARRGEAARLGAEQAEPGLERVRHRHRRRCGDGGFRLGERIAEIALEQAQRLRIARLALGRRAGQGVALRVLEVHARGLSTRPRQDGRGAPASCRAARAGYRRATVPCAGTARWARSRRPASGRCGAPAGPARPASG